MRRTRNVCKCHQPDFVLLSDSGLTLGQLSSKGPCGIPPHRLFFACRRVFHTCNLTSTRTNRSIVPPSGEGFLPLIGCPPRVVHCCVSTNPLFLSHLCSCTDVTPPRIKLPSPISFSRKCRFIFEKTVPAVFTRSLVLTVAHLAGIN